MMPRLQAEEQTVRITAARVGSGATDKEGERAIQDYERALDEQRDGLTPSRTKATITSKDERQSVATRLGIHLGRPPETEKDE